MSVKNHIVLHEYDEETGKTRLVKRTKYGTFEATVKCTDEDSDVKSQFIGIHLAEYLCDLKSLHAKARILAERAIGVETAYINMVMNLPAEISDSDFYNKMKYQVDVAHADAKRAKEKYKKMASNYKKYAEKLVSERRTVFEYVDARRTEKAEDTEKD